MKFLKQHSVFFVLSSIFLTGIYILQYDALIHYKEEVFYEGYISETHMGILLLFIIFMASISAIFKNRKNRKETKSVTVSKNAFIFHLPALIIDFILTFPLAFALYVASTVTWYYFFPLPSSGEFMELSSQSSLPSLMNCIFLTFFIYSTLMESSRWQGTLGKKIMSMRVTTSKEERLSFLCSALRSAIKTAIIIFFFFSYIYLKRSGLFPNNTELDQVLYPDKTNLPQLLFPIAFIAITAFLSGEFRKDGRWAHDYLAGTMVIFDRKAKSKGETP